MKVLEFITLYIMDLTVSRVFVYVLCFVVALYKVILPTFDLQGYYTICRLTQGGMKVARQ